jgi:group I intron endonuclease
LWSSCFYQIKIVLEKLKIETKPYGVIYKITNLIDGKVYVGQTKQKPERRWSQHKKEKRGNCAIHKAINKYGKENFIFEVIDSANNQEELNNLEMDYIKKLDSLVPQGYNILAYHKGAMLWTKERFANISNIKKNNATSKYFGVHYDKRRNLWRSEFYFKGNRIIIGRFDTQEEAAKARDLEVAKDKYENVFELNFPELKEQYLCGEITVLESFQKNKRKNRIRAGKTKQFIPAPNIYYNSKTNSCSVIITNNFELHFVGTFNSKESGIEAYRKKLKELDIEDDLSPIIHCI